MLCQQLLPEVFVVEVNLLSATAKHQETRCNSLTSCMTSQILALIADVHTSCMTLILALIADVHQGTTRGTSFLHIIPLATN